MYWQEHIDILKKKFPQSDFKDPFTDWPNILQNIESRFIVKQDANYHFANWPDNIKNHSVVRKFPRNQIAVEIGKLNSTMNYWLVVGGDVPTSKLLVYDCKVTPMKSVISLTNSSFFIVDKKYKWLTFFQVNNDQITLVKSGSGSTPFDE